MVQLDGKKVISLTTGDLTDVMRMYFVTVEKDLL
jgi:hypothetical protein